MSNLRAPEEDGMAPRMADGTMACCVLCGDVELGHSVQKRRKSSH
eukprot:CAMPEP_0175808152 /NCGR_PEP_ID=MMETSP0107_2-20121207/2104_1 /TAXON_ID=195067 ORGANISM="Goniomonas pacifica, Strain CCMP1869" /NCGR_SAMPLE_ID=MMETSP0107_2 /ASSEMBLY_ACC=CAM_ASM_000203 /LENGTH=44 /DNA_ID= /DNA_START= /DNA_END= /DNA_ORIENTATION=